VLVIDTTVAADGTFRRGPLSTGAAARVGFSQNRGLARGLHARLGLLLGAGEDFIVNTDAENSTTRADTRAVSPIWKPSDFSDRRPSDFDTSRAFSPIKASPALGKIDRRRVSWQRCRRRAQRLRAIAVMSRCC